MPPFTLPSRSEILNTLETLVIGSAGGLLFLWLELPGGLISGAMIAVAGAGIAGRPLGLPQPIAHIILMTLGLSLGSMVSPAMIKNLSAYPVTIALLAAATFCATFGSSFYLQQNPRLGPHLGAIGRKPRRAVAGDHAGHRAQCRRRRHRGGADHAGDHPDRGGADAARRHRRDGPRSAAVARPSGDADCAGRTGGGRGRGGAVAALA